MLVDADVSREVQPGFVQVHCRHPLLLPSGSALHSMFRTDSEREVLSACRRLYAAGGAGTLYMKPVRHPDDNDYPASIRRAEIATLIATPAGESLVGTEVWPPEGEQFAREVDWPANAMFQYRGYHFHVPECVRRAVSDMDSRGSLTRTEFLDEAATVASTVMIERDELRRITRIVQTNDRNTSAEGRFVYDEGRRTISTIVSLNGTVVSSKVTTVDEHGLPAADEETAMDGSTRRVLYTYTFNERGDWIERVASAGSGATITRRQLTYSD